MQGVQYSSDQLLVLGLRGTGIILTKSLTCENYIGSVITGIGFYSVTGVWNRLSGHAV